MKMRKLVLGIAALAIAGSAVGYAATRPDVITVGAIYPTGGGQGRGGIDEYRGVRLAAEYWNRGSGRDVRLRLEPADSADQAPSAIERLVGARVPVILGSYGSTVSGPAAEGARRGGVVFWETGAVGDLGMAASSSDKVFRFPPTGGALGSSAVSFARDVLLPKLGRKATSLRYGVTYVDDVYGRAVGRGAVAEIRRAGLTLSGDFPYTLQGADYAGIVGRIASARTDVLFVSAYLDDGVALRKETVRQRVPLVASVGTSSSYCMHEFGQALGRNAVGLFASDKPDGHVLDPTRLRPEAGAALRWAREEFKRRYDHEMTAPALTGFSGAWALFRHVLPRARSLTPAGVASAARSVRVPTGGLPHGSGLEFGAAGRPGAGDNLRATSVIWEWVKPYTRAVVWPPEFATQAVVALEL
ncbi:MAG: ABC transporter substrate-binding protein [Actinomycetota bacterium]